MKNEANLNSSNIVTTSYSKMVYNSLPTKTKNGTKPNEANLKPISNTTKPSDISGKGVFLLPLICKNEPNFPDPRNTATPCSGSPYSNLLSELRQKSKPKANPIQTQSKPISNTTKPSFLLGNSAKLKTLLLRNKANFNSLKLTATTCCIGTYNDLKTKPKNGANPNKPNFFTTSEPLLQFLPFISGCGIVSWNIIL